MLLIHFTAAGRTGPAAVGEESFQFFIDLPDLFLEVFNDLILFRAAIGDFDQLLTG